MLQNETTPQTTFQKEGVISTDYLWKKLINLLKTNGNHDIEQHVKDLYQDICLDSKWAKYCLVMLALNDLRYKVSSPEEKSLFAELLSEELFCRPREIDSDIKGLSDLADFYKTREEYRFEKEWHVTSEMKEFPLWRHWTERVFDLLDEVSELDKHAWEISLETFFARCGKDDLIFLSQSSERDRSDESANEEVHENLRKEEFQRQHHFKEIRDKVSLEVYGSDNIWSLDNIKKLFLLYIKRLVSEEGRRAQAENKINYIIGLFPRLNRGLLDPIYDNAFISSVEPLRHKFTSPCASTIEQQIEGFKILAHQIVLQAGQLIPAEEMVDASEKEAAPVHRPASVSMSPYVKGGLKGALIGIVLPVSLAIIAGILFATGAPVAALLSVALVACAVKLGLAGLIATAVTGVLTSVGLGAFVGVANATLSEKEKVKGSTLIVVKNLGAASLRSPSEAPSAMPLREAKESVVKPKQAPRQEAMPEHQVNQSQLVPLAVKAPGPSR
jgi:hypothetical protein